MAVCLLGDGGTSKGDFYEGMNMAGVWHAPLVIVINTTSGQSRCRAAPDRGADAGAEAIAAGIPGEQVDGNDVVAVRHRVGEAIARARAGGGPALIEAITYRLGDHTTADDASRYRDEASVKAHWQEEPLLRLRTHLLALHAWDAAREEALVKACSQQVAQAVETYLAMPPPDPAAMFDCLYAAMPAELQAQLEIARRFPAPHG